MDIITLSLKLIYQIRIVLQLNGHQMTKQETAHTPQVFQSQILTVMRTILFRFLTTEKRSQQVIGNLQSHRLPLPQFKLRVVT